MSSSQLGPDSSAPSESSNSAGATATITLPDGSTKTVVEGATALDLATEIGPGLARAALVAEVDGVPTDMATALADGQSIKFLTDRDDAALEHLRQAQVFLEQPNVLRLLANELILVFEMLAVDVEQLARLVEKPILIGQQGTQFGRNVTAGA